MELEKMLSSTAQCLDEKAVSSGVAFVKSMTDELLQVMRVVIAGCEQVDLFGQVEHELLKFQSELRRLIESLSTTMMVCPVSVCQELYQKQVTKKLNIINQEAQE